jgi:hypothetical protein
VARRTRLSPAEVGLPEGNRRRTPGLRREEISQLEGISLTWYTWLEQGRPIQVSSYVLERLSRAFRLDGQERLHLYSLARISPPSRDLGPCPSMITDRRWNAVAWNAAARAVFGDFSVADGSGLTMIVHVPMPGTGTEERMRKLLAGR